MSALAVKSVSGSASTKTARWIVLKLSVVATSASTRPDHGGIDRDVAGLNAVGDDRAIGGTTQIGLGDDGGNRGRRRGRGQKPSARQGDAYGHGSPPAARARRRWRPILTERGRPCDNFVTVDNAQAPVEGLDAPKSQLPRLLHFQCATEFRAGDFRRHVPEYRRQSTGQHLVPEFEAAGQGLIRQHALSSQQ